MKSAIIYLTHFINNYIKNEIEKLKSLSMANFDLYITYETEKCRFEMPVGVKQYPFSYKQIRKHGFGTWGCTLLDGNMHQIILDFFKNHSNYDYIWLIEYDVRFTGNWKGFFSYFESNTADFISSHIAYKNEEPSWGRWNEISLVNTPVESFPLVKSFNPICRLSNRFLRLLDERCSLGDKGHYEVLLPILANMLKLEIFDFGGVGRFSSRNKPNLFYTNYTYKDKEITCTHRFRPSYNADELLLKNKIYHPIK